MGILMKTTEVDLGTTSYRSRAVEQELFGAMEAPSNGSDYFSDTLHTIAIKTRETEFGGIIQPIPISLKTYTQLQFQDSITGYELQKQMKNVFNSTRLCDERPSTSGCKSPIKAEEGIGQKITRPPKKKWIKEYLEEEPRSPVSVRVVTGLPVTPRSNGVVRSTSPVLPAAPPAPPASTLASVTIEPVSSLAAPPPAPLDFVQEHSRLRTTSTSHGLPQVPSPPSVGSNCSGSGSSGSNGSAPRAGTREVHNKLEKNRRAHLKECFELLKRQLPATSDDKKISNLSILGSAIRYIQVLRRKERDCEHEMERLAREKIAAQQRLAALRREVSVRVTARPRSVEAGTEDKERDERINGQVLGIPISITSSPPHSVTRVDPSPPQTLNLSTKLRTLPIQITPTTSQVVRTTYGARHNTLTLTTLAPADTSTQNGQTLENGVTSTIGTTLVHPAQIHLPLSQVVGSGGLVVGPAALQLVSTSGGLRVLHTNGITTGENNRIARENGIVTSTTTGHSEGGVVVSGLTPIVVSQPTAAAHLLQAHTLTHKMVETQMVKGNVSSVTPLTVSAQYLSATTIVKPVVVVSGAHTPPAPPT